MKKLVILLWMTFFLLICHNWVMLNLNVAIVSMVRFMPDTMIENSKPIICPNATFYWSENEAENIVDAVINQEDTYNWNNFEKRMVLSAYHWISWISILPSGILAQKYSSKVLVGWALCISSVMSSIIPFAAQYGPYPVFYVRMIQGLLSEMIMPGVTTVSSNWSHKENRGKFVTALIAGLIVGISSGSYIFGYIGLYWHWKYIFHFTSLCGIVWTIFWYFLIHDSPEKHPTISLKEKSKILEKRRHATNARNIPIPWKEILLSVPLNLCYLNVGTMMVNFFVLGTYMPLYFSDMYGYDSNKSGIIISISQIICGVFTVILGWFSDFVMKKRWLSISKTRKSFGAFGCFSSAMPLIIIVFTKCNAVVTIICLLLSTSFRSVYLFGVEPAIVDMSPRFCGITHAFMGIASELIILIFSMGIGIMSKTLQTEDFWKALFILTAIITIFPSALFTMWGSAELQDWNQGSKKYREKNKNLEEEEIRMAIIYE